MDPMIAVGIGLIPMFLYFTYEAVMMTAPWTWFKRRAK